ncbi:hypothetical protein BO94DRAFT_627641 [Aspergillus sclerotioniger CBS 115572]|uniref:Kelch repeat protein n=1 Tax=Aspergillus sclerotioniger CBS 115572 TaxID=1450535 RepID=A0A317VJU2_9EURO|nr:hypothetical protein BO94DRAFT_627641 [Aspergillus sclerotioniger CBS 115572]PWY73122.1 hypothetical protein BO94DRAFT_627641 [Aspergillus sclerotioniger CBS 115572]
MAILRRLILTLLVTWGVEGQHDPLKDFCRRFSHQTAVVDRRLYIDGGFINYNPLAQNPVNESNTNILYAALDIDNLGMPQEYNNLSKPSTAPSVNGGILWPDTINKLLYLYGGEFSNNTSPPAYSSWVYDIIYNTWNQTVADPTQSSIQRASYGAGVTLQDRAVGYYYGGWLSNTSVPGWGKAAPLVLSSFLQYDMLQNTWTNSSGPDSVGRAEGVMVYIPASDRGMLVYFGGVQTSTSASTNATGSGSGGVIAQGLEDILLYDIANSKWYSQKATGQIPGDRRRFCGGATWAQDKSSYNIYIYGGLSVPTGVGYDDIYILSIPSFTWIKWYPTTSEAGFPHHSLSCNVIDGAQMIVMGGTFPNSTACDVPQNYGMHNMDLGKQNSEQKKWIRFRPNVTTYVVPSEVISVVGGGSTGGATLTTPTSGFDNPDLQTYFQRVYTPSSRSPTRAIPTQTGSSNSTTSEHQSTHVGAIVGGVVGGVVGAAAIAGILYWCLRRQKNTSGERDPPGEIHHEDIKLSDEVEAGQNRWTGGSMATELPDEGSVSGHGNGQRGSNRWTGQSLGSSELADERSGLVGGRQRGDVAELP